MRVWPTRLDDDDDYDEVYDDTQIEKSRMSRFSRGKLEAGRNELGLCTARYMSLKVLCPDVVSESVYY